MRSTKFLPPSIYRRTETRPRPGAIGTSRPATFFEEWGDARAYDGTVTILQPMIEPLYDSASPSL